MILEYYTHGLKWKELITNESDIKKGFVTFFIQDYPDIADRSKFLNAAYLRVHEIYFKIETNHLRKIDFKDIPNNLLDDILSHSSWRNEFNKFQTQYGNIYKVSINEGYIIVNCSIARCDNPHVYISDEGELAYREIEEEIESTVLVVKNKKSVFDILDLE